MQGNGRAVHSLLIATFLLFGVSVVLWPSAALANHCNDRAKSGSKATEQTLSIAIQDPSNPSRTIHCIPLNAPTIQTNPIFGFLRTVLQFLAGGVGLAIVGGLIVGGIIHTTARANAQQVQKAETMIRSSLIALALFIFTFAIMNFLIPGGILF